MTKPADYNNPENPDSDSDSKTPETTGQQTPINEMERKTGSGTEMDVRPGAAPEAPGARSETPGAPNQGTESR